MWVIHIKIFENRKGHFLLTTPNTMVMPVKMPQSFNSWSTPSFVHRNHPIMVHTAECNTLNPFYLQTPKARAASPAKPLLISWPHPYEIRSQDQISHFLTLPTPPDAAASSPGPLLVPLKDGTHAFVILCSRAHAPQ